MKKISVLEALVFALVGRGEGLVSEMRIAELLQSIYKSKLVGNTPVKARRSYPVRGDIKRATSGLLESGVIRKIGLVSRHGLYETNAYESTPEEILCHLDPLCYLSHLSAMSWHGFTNRRLTAIFCSSPVAQNWNVLIKDRLKELPQSEHQPADSWPEAFSHFTKTPPSKIKKLSVHRRESRQWRDSACRTYERGVKVASVGQTFLDMVRTPELCGGIHHVIECYIEHGARYKKQILSTASQHEASKLEKSRIGYLLEDCAGVVDNQTLNDWCNTAVQRGGSRKLDAKTEYSPNYSERWALSINV